MKNIPCKDGVIYNAMKHHRIKHLIRTLFMLFVFLAYLFVQRAYIGNVVFKSFDIDEGRFAREIETININKDLAAKSDGSHLIRSYAVKSGSYWQDQKYEFDISFSDVKKLPLGYTTRNTTTNYSETDTEGVFSAQLYSAKLSGINVFILAYPHQEVKSGEKITGIFAEMANVIRTDVSNLGSFEGQEFCEFVFDTRGLEMGSEKFDIMACVILLIIFLYLAVKLVIYFINPLLTPTYKSINHYGDLETVVMDVENQLRDIGEIKITKNNPAITKDWIISQDSFKLKIVKNHGKAQDSSRYGSRL